MDDDDDDDDDDVPKSQVTEFVCLRRTSLRVESVRQGGRDE